MGTLLGDLSVGCGQKAALSGIKSELEERKWTQGLNTCPGASTAAGAQDWLIGS